MIPYYIFYLEASQFILGQKVDIMVHNFKLPMQNMCAILTPKNALNHP